ncbi:hypothetical protein [Nonomuraea sp. NBC_00507]|uniref:hypothetical protein n=1 Tax=Nonomuraea sp. NBC_00507 TaxID=2976002 RepID=UPI003FA5D1D1
MALAGKADVDQAVAAARAAFTAPEWARMPPALEFYAGVADKLGGTTIPLGLGLI